MRSSQAQGAQRRTGNNIFRGHRLPWRRVLSRRLWWRATAAVAACFGLAFGVIWHVQSSTAAFRFTEPSGVPPARVALVFGAGVRPDGRLSRMLAERVNAAIQLYQTGRVEKLLMSGDNSRVDYDEVTAMKRHAVARGVVESDIILDYAGFSTYESCYRAKAIFGLNQAVLVTQSYHLPRAVYTCRALGVDAVGLGTPDWGSYAPTILLNYSARESLATLKAIVDLYITRPKPTFLGPFEGVS